MARSMHLWLLAFYRDIQLAVTTIVYHFTRGWKNYSEFEKPIDDSIAADTADEKHEKQEKRKIALIVHGLHGSPRNWYLHRQLLSKRGWCTLAPFLPNGGNASTQKCVDFLISKLRTIQFDPQNDRLALIGESNGTRIVPFLYRRLNEIYDISPPMVLVAGFYGGIPWTQWFPIDWFIRRVMRLHPEILCTFAGKNYALQHTLVPDRTLFVVSPYDTRFIPVTSGLPTSPLPTSSCLSCLTEPSRILGHSSVKLYRIDLQIDFLESKLDSCSSDRNETK